VSRKARAFSVEQIPHDENRRLRRGRGRGRGRRESRRGREEAAPEAQDPPRRWRLACVRTDSATRSASLPHPGAARAQLSPPADEKQKGARLLPAGARTAVRAESEERASRADPETREAMQPSPGA
jgi:hypothetical protein